MKHLNHFLAGLLQRMSEWTRSPDLRAFIRRITSNTGAWLPVRKAKRIAGWSAMVSALLIFILFLVPAMQERMIRVEKISAQPGEDDMKAIQAQSETLQKSIRKLERNLAGKYPAAAFLVINTSENKFYLYKNRKQVRAGDCSTGSYIRLEGGDQQKWLFKTPRGKFRIQGKITSPVWRKPDWAFVEEGLSIPPQYHPSRYEYGVLGDYALSLGQGYLIHGTLYKRMLGMPVTHGCVRLNDEDLEAVFNTLVVGSRVYIY